MEKIALNHPLQKYNLKRLFEYWSFRWKAASVPFYCSTGDIKLVAQWCITTPARWIPMPPLKALPLEKGRLLMYRCFCGKNRDREWYCHQPALDKVQRYRRKVRAQSLLVNPLNQTTILVLGTFAVLLQYCQAPNPDRFEIAKGHQPGKDREKKHYSTVAAWKANKKVP